MEEEKNVEKEEMYSKEEYMKVKRSNEKNKAIIVVLVFAIVLLLILIVIYFMNGKKQEEKKENNGGQVVDVTPTPASNSEFKPWMSYILEQNITKIELSKFPCEEDTFEAKTIEINVNQLKDIFKKFMNYRLRVSYIGGGGWMCGQVLNIKYLKNGTEYEIEYHDGDGSIEPSSNGCESLNDKDLEVALNSSVDYKENDLNKYGECVMYNMMDVPNDLLGEYLR